MPDFRQADDSGDQRERMRMRGSEYLSPGQFLHSFTTIFVMVSFGKS